MSDKSILRTLAKRLAELAARPSEDDKKALWYRHNSLEETRPLVFCDPEKGWEEIIPVSSLACEGEVARSFERTLRKELFWAEHMRDDRAVEARFDVPILFAEDWGLQTRRIGDIAGGAYRIDPPIKNYSDIERLHFPQIIIDQEQTDLRYTIACEMFGDILTVRKTGRWWWSLGLTINLARLRGLDQLMYDMYDHPDELHSLMALLRDGTMAMLDFLENGHLLTANHDGSYVGSGGFGWTHELPGEAFEGTIRLRDMWGFAESQETSQISPAMFEEFVLPYQMPILERFGLNAYGCCEPLNQRWHAVEKVPRLRRVSVSPWSDITDMAEKLGGRYIFSMKPNPSYLAVPSIDEGFIRQSLRSALDASRDCRVEIIMKDCTTIGGNPQNVIRWTRIAMEEAQRL